MSNEPLLKGLKVLGVPFALERAPTDNFFSAPELGEHTEIILGELGYSWDPIGQLKGSGVIP